jgi:DNA-binding transcriptional MerR regulator
MVDEELLIHELAQRAGISIRTIRYYIDEGLLPQPKYQGKYSYYSANYLDRLELIRRLKETYLPLREIREIMNTLTDDEVLLKLNELSTSSPKVYGQPLPAQPAEKPGEKALQYINRLMDDQTRYKTKGLPDKAQPLTTQEQILPIHRSLNLSDSTTSQDEEVWQRITLFPGVELHLRQPLAPQVDSRVRQLIIYSKKIFSTKP